MTIEVTCKVDVYGLDDKDVDTLAEDAPVLLVRSTWNHPDRVTLEVGGHRYQVFGCDLRAAVDNAIHADG